MADLLIRGATLVLTMDDGRRELAEAFELDIHDFSVSEANR